MKNILNYINELDEECDDLVMATMKKEYSYLLQMGALFSNLRPKWRWLSIFQLTFYLIVTGYNIILLSVTALSWENDIDNASQSAHFASLAMIALIILIIFPYQRWRIVDIMRIVGKSYYQYEDGFKSANEERWKKDIRKFKIALLTIVPLYLLACVMVCIVIGPLIDKYGSDERPEYVGNIYTKLPMAMVFPYQVNSPIRYLASLGSESICAGMVAFVISGADLMLIFLSQDIVLQMRILREAINSIERRALVVYKIIYKQSTSKRPMKELYADARYMDIVHWCIKQNVIHHKIICRCFDHINTAGKWPLGVAFLFGSIVIAFSLFTAVASENSRISSQLLSLMLLAVEVWNMLILCYMGQQLTDMSEGISDDLYNVKWRHWNKRCTLSILIFRERLKRPLVLTAAGLTPINLELFATVMNTAYSYFNLILAYL